jgi:hypothetical protein
MPLRMFDTLKDKWIDLDVAPALSDGGYPAPTREELLRHL